MISKKQNTALGVDDSLPSEVPHIPYLPATRAAFCQDHLYAPCHGVVEAPMCSHQDSGGYHRRSESSALINGPNATVVLYRMERQLPSPAAATPSEDKVVLTPPRIDRASEATVAYLPPIDWISLEAHEIQNPLM